MTEEKERNEKAYFDAMTPRDRYGNKEPLATRDGLDQEILYPYWKLDQHGCVRGMVFFDEFSNGKSPDDLAYAPGYQKTPIPVDDPRYAESIVFNDPTLNLPHTEQHLIHVYRENQGNGMNIQIVSQNAAEDSDVCSSARVVNATSTHMIVRTAKGDVPLANFSIEAVEHRIVHRSAKPNDYEDEFEIVVNNETKTAHIVVAAKNINTLSNAKATSTSTATSQFLGAEAVLGLLQT